MAVSAPKADQGTRRSKLSHATYMPADPDLWGAHEERVADPIRTLRDFLNEFRERTRQISAVMLERDDAIQTIGGVTASCLAIVFNAMDAAIHRPDGTQRLGDLFTAMADVEDWYEGEASGGEKDEAEGAAEG